MLNQSERVNYVKNMIENFTLARSDAVTRCLFCNEKNGQRSWHSGIYISFDTEPNFYPDIFVYWVRAYICFMEDLILGIVLLDAHKDVVCSEISTDEFSREYLQVLKSGTPDEYFLERQSFPESYVEFENREFTSAFEMLHTPLLKSCVAKSSDSYVAFFHLTTGIVFDQARY